MRPKSPAALVNIGIESAEQLAGSDPFADCARLKASQPGITLNLLYALIGVVENCDWTDLARQDRLRILLRLGKMASLSRGCVPRWTAVG